MRSTAAGILHYPSEIADQSFTPNEPQISQTGVDPAPFRENGQENYA
jgi:hypothetical protein